MQKLLHGVTRLLAGAALLSATLALAAPPLLLPPPAAVAKADKPLPFRSQGHRSQLNIEELKRQRHGDEVELRLPSGRKHVFVADLVKDEGNGITTWVGYAKGSREKMRAIITHGPGGSFGTLSTPDGEFRLFPGDGFDWLVDMAQEAPHIPPVDLAEEPLMFPPRLKSFEQSEHSAEFQLAIPGVNSVAVSKATPSQVVVDLMIVYTQTYAANLGSNLQTRLNFLVTTANTMYADSEVGIVLRLVHSVAVNYSDAIDNSTALETITPANGGGVAPFTNIESLRTQYGADMVALLRNGSDFGGSGVAWVANAPISAGFAPYMYSVVTGCVRGCEWVLVHELGHNMGNLHDRATTSWQDLDGGVASQGSYPYSYGYYSCTANTLSCNPSVPGSCGSQPECSTPRSGTNNFADIMAYFHATTTRNFKFSNPDLTCSGSLGVQQPCGVAAGQPNAANAALTMNNNRAALSALRASTVSVTPTATTTTLATSSASVAVNGSVTFTATVAAASGSPTGTVAFRSDGNAITGCSAVSLSAGRAVCTTSFSAAGSYSITALYSGSSSFTASTSTALTQTVGTVAASISLLSSGNPATTGSAIAFTATVSGNQAAPGGTVHFRNNNVSITGCTAVALVASSANSSSATCTTAAMPLGSYSITAHYSGSASYGAVDSGAIVQTVMASLPSTPDPARLFGISTRMRVLTGNDVMIGGFIVGGASNKTVVVRARGPSLIPSGITNALANPTLQLVRASDQTTIAFNDDWGQATNAAQISASGFAPSNGFESAIMMNLAPGAYTAIVAGAAGGTGVGIVEVYEVDVPEIPLAGISTRGQVSTGNDVMIGGFIIQGSGPQTVVVRARGPSLFSAGINNYLPDPVLQLVRASDQVTIASNDDWGSAPNAAEIAASGFAPANPDEATILMTLSPGAYTAVLTGAGSTGVAILEVYVVP